MKVLLINPPTTNIALPFYGWKITVEDSGAFPPVGLMYLAGAMRERTIVKVAMIDMLLERMKIPELEQKIKDFYPDIVGITTSTPILYDALEVAKAVKRIKKDCHVCMGGPHVSFYPEETICKPEIDSLLIGESEYNFISLVQALNRGDDLKNVSGVITKEMKGDVIKTIQPGYINDINSLPFPAFDLLPFRRYSSIIGTGNSVATICSSRGCPYECTFCYKHYLTYRSRTPENIISELKLYYDLRIKEFYFFDEMFNITPQRVIDIAGAILNSGMKIIWSFRGRVGQINEEMLAIAKKSGCRWILLGVETATEEGLRLIKKKITIKQIIETFRVAKKIGIETGSYWIIGFPHHRAKQDIIDLINFAIKLDPNYAQFNILIPYPETEIFQEGVIKGVLDSGFWRNHAMRPMPKALIPLWEEYLSRDELSDFMRICYKRFYLRPQKIIQHLINTSNFKQLKNKIRGALALIS